MEISIYRINYGMILFVFMLLFFFFKSKSKTRAYDGYFNSQEGGSCWIKCTDLLWLAGWYLVFEMRDDESMSSCNSF